MPEDYGMKKISKEDLLYDTDKEPAGELAALPREILDISILDHAKGIEYCGDFTDYVEALDIYRRSIDVKAAKIESSLETMDVEAYTMIVHSLKSTSLAVGADPIFELAKTLEQAGIDKDIDTIKADTDRLLHVYRGLKKDLDEYFEKVR